MDNPNHSPTREIRFNKDNLQWFEENFPWRGSLSGFLNQCLEKYREEWGDIPPPAQVASKVVQSMAPTRQL
jgi:hypothetical protein